MKTSAKRLTSTLLLSSVMLIGCLTGCVNHARPPDTSWVRPIYFEEETLQWLKDRQPWPNSLYVDLDKVRKHNLKVQEINKQ